MTDLFAPLVPTIKLKGKSMQWDNDLLLVEQVRLEREMHTGGINRFRKSQERHLEGSPADTAWNRSLTKDFVFPLSAALEVFLKHERNKGMSRVSAAVPLLELLPSDAAALIAVKVLLGAVTRDLSLTDVTLRIGEALEDNIRFTRLEETAPKYIKRVQESLKKAHSKAYSHQKNTFVNVEKRLTEATGGYAVDIDRWVAWDKASKLKVGSTMIQLALSALEYEGKPVFERNIVSRVKGYRISLSPEVSGWIEEYKEFMEVLSPEFSPCVVKPRDWVNPLNGGYYTPELNRTFSLVKVARRKHLRHYTKQATPKFYNAVNFLQSVPWEVNRELLDAVLSLQHEKSSSVPSAEPSEKPVNPVRDDLKDLKGADLHKAMCSVELEEFNQWKNDMRDWYTDNNKRVGNYLTFTRTLNAAKAFSKYPAVYFVWTADSRGRLYSKSSTIDPQGNDFQKALLRFHEGKALGSTGRYWLAIQGANTLGLKGSFDARVQAIEELEETIKDIATAPNVFNDWQNADEPFQHLAWCLEWNRLLAWEDSGRDAKLFVSHLPVAQDGSCSGTQHYSAMLRDEVGGKAVNLLEGNAPEDIYGEVAKVLIGKLNTMQEGGFVKEFKAVGEVISTVLLQQLAREWLGVGVDRELTKRPVMILPYGGTKVSAFDYVEEHLRDLQSAEERVARLQGRQANLAHPFKEYHLGAETPARVLTDLLWDSIGEVVVKAREAMKVIQRVAFVLAKANIPIQWTTPSGFVVIREKNKKEQKRVRTFMMGELVCRNVLQEDTDTLDPYAQKNGAAPDFVHSNDACHVHLTADAASKAGITSLSCIHDSIATHACDTEQNRGILIDKFIEIYAGRDMLAELVADAEVMLGEEIKVDMPEWGSLDLEDIRKSTYLFS